MTREIDWVALEAAAIGRLASGGVIACNKGSATLEPACIHRAKIEIQAIFPRPKSKTPLQYLVVFSIFYW